MCTNSLAAVASATTIAAAAAIVVAFRQISWPKGRWYFD